MTSKELPDGLTPLGKSKFNFNCHDGVECFMVCCKNVDMFLYPFDILRLKNALNISSQEFMEQYTNVVKGISHPYFPSIMLRLINDEDKSCPFLKDQGCGLYNDRPSACRTYPLERGVDRTPEKGMVKDFYFLTNHTYCKGHYEEKSFTVKKWIRDQRLDEYNMMNDLWAEVDTVFAGNPWTGEGSGGQKQQIVFTACYDIDNFRIMAAKHQLIDRYNLTRDQKRRIKESDTELLKFSFEWVKDFLGSPSSLMAK